MAVRTYRLGSHYDMANLYTQCTHFILKDNAGDTIDRIEKTSMVAPLSGEQGFGTLSHTATITFDVPQSYIDANGTGRSATSMVLLKNITGVDYPLRDVDLATPVALTVPGTYRVTGFTLQAAGIVD